MRHDDPAPFAVPEPASPRDRRVLFFGDSHVAGVGDPEGKGWVGRVVANAFRCGCPLTAYNLGVRRETSEQVAARLRAEARPRLAIETEGRVVLSFGANDCTIEDGTPRVALERSCAALAKILGETTAAAMPTMMIGPAAVSDAEQNGRIKTLSAAFAEVCDGSGIPFVSVIEPLLGADAWMREVAAGDGAHPGAAGYGGSDHCRRLHRVAARHISNYRRQPEMNAPRRPSRQVDWVACRIAKGRLRSLR